MLKPAQIGSRIATTEQHTLLSREVTAVPAFYPQVFSVREKIMSQKKNHIQREISLEEQHSSRLDDRVAQNHRSNRPTIGSRHIHRGDEQ